MPKISRAQILGQLSQLSSLSWSIYAHTGAAMDLTGGALLHVSQKKVGHAPFSLKSFSGTKCYKTRLAVVPHKLRVAHVQLFVVMQRTQGVLGTTAWEA